MYAGAERVCNSEIVLSLSSLAAGVLGRATRGASLLQLETSKPAEKPAGTRQEDLCRAAPDVALGANVWNAMQLLQHKTRVTTSLQVAIALRLETTSLFLHSH